MLNNTSINTLSTETGNQRSTPRQVSGDNI